MRYSNLRIYTLFIRFAVNFFATIKGAMMWLRQHFFSLSLVLLLVLTIGASYVRFMVLKDYTVAFEGECDPYYETCFIGCEDDDCTKEYFYSKVERGAQNLEAQCGTDITDCVAAHKCLPQENGNCEIAYCDPIVDGDDSCEDYTEKDFYQITEDSGEEELNTDSYSDTQADGETILEETIIQDEL